MEITHRRAREIRNLIVFARTAEIMRLMREMPFIVMENEKVKITEKPQNSSIK
jgi:hypothetical protein